VHIQLETQKMTWPAEMRNTVWRPWQKEIPADKGPKWKSETVSLKKHQQREARHQAAGTLASSSAAFRDLMHRQATRQAL